MASGLNEDLFQLNEIDEELKLEFKRFDSCFHKYFEGQMNGNSQCPECYEHLTLDQLSLSPSHVKSSKCDLCLMDEIESTARNGCYDCQKVFCDNCSVFHKKFHPKHNVRNLDGIESGKVLKAMVTGMCYLHQKERDSYCERCNVCFCNACYQKHLVDSPGCSSPPLSVKEEVMKQKSKGPTLAKRIDNLETSLRWLNEKMRNHTEELNLDCNSKCVQLWQNFEEIVENAREKTKELCKEIRHITAEQVKRWNNLSLENEKILMELEIWRENLHHLMNESQQDVDVVCGLRSLGSKLSQLHKSVQPEEKCQLGVIFSDWWLQVMEQLKEEKIGSVHLMVELPAKNFVFDKQFNLHGSNLDITTIHISDENDHIFVCDYNNKSVIEFTDQGKLVCECRLFDGINKFSPWDMCSISQDIFVVACGRERKMIFLQKKKNYPLQIKKICSTNKEFLSLCAMKESIFACDHFFQIDSFTKEGHKIKTLVTGESRGGFWPRIRADPSTDNFWGTKLDSSEVFCFNPDGEKLRSVKTDEIITDFCVEDSGQFYFCNYEGIFFFSPKNILYKFEKKI